MSIEKIRSSLLSDDLKVFDDIMENVHLANNVKHDIINFKDVRNFIIETSFDQFPKTGLISFRDGKIANISCY